jgi:hypothetical protein
LQSEERDYRKAAQTVKSCIGLIESELDEAQSLGSRAFLDQHFSQTLSFDPPALRDKIES